MQAPALTGRRRPRSRDERGYVAVVAAVLISFVLLGVAAIGVDTARWFVERERVQRAADAAALAGVVYLPDNFDRAVATARESARLNGYDDRAQDVSVDVSLGERRSQLEVTITSTIPNQFGAAIGIQDIDIDRSAVADYTSPAPMGSPCNVFGNEPPGGNNRTTGYAASGPQGSQIPSAYRASGICRTDPNFWAVVAGPRTDKQNGDRYGTVPCTLSPTPYGCAPVSNVDRFSRLNSENTYPEGYFFSIKVPQAAVNSPITLQIYDPAFINAGANCSTNMPNTSSTTSNTLNDYVTDARVRYTIPTASWLSTTDKARARLLCPGDNRPLSAEPSASSVVNPTTSFAVRAANDAQDPMAGAAFPQCTAQFPGGSQPPTLDQLTKSSRNYLDYYARLWHQWVPLCTFTPTRAGDYYLQVRTNVALGGTEEIDRSASPAVPTRIFRGNPAVLARNGNTKAGEGSNAFAVRALSSRADQISVSGWARMPIFQNVPESTATFNLLRVLPAAAGQTISFEFYDAADARDNNGNPVSGTVQVIPPKTAAGASPAPYGNCSGALNDKPYAGLRNCLVPINGTTHNGQVQRMSIPIPSTYTCKDSELTGCWFTIKIDLNSASSITDFTTWDASLDGDPVRLIE